MERKPRSPVPQGPYSPRHDPVPERRSPSTAAWLREAKALGDALHSGDQEWSPSRGATRDMGERSFLSAALREAKAMYETKHSGNQECLRSSPSHPLQTLHNSALGMLFRLGEDLEPNLPNGFGGHRPDGDDWKAS